MGNLGVSEFIILLIILLLIISIPILTYFLGKKSGYRQGQLDLYKQKEQMNNPSNS